MLPFSNKGLADFPLQAASQNTLLILVLIALDNVLVLFAFLVPFHLYDHDRLWNFAADRLVAFLGSWLLELL
jgi:hypothetical protein